MPSPTSYETGTAEAWLTVLDYVSRVAQAVEGGDWYYLVDKSDALERAVRALRGRVWDDDTNSLDVEDPHTGRPLRGEAVMEVVRHNAGLYRASRALYPPETRQP
jgi:hypothetical protein